MIAYRQIVVPTDFSPFSHHAIRYAQALAKTSEGRIHFVHVVNQRYLESGGVVGVYVSQADVDTTLKGMVDHANKKMTELVRKAGAMNVEAEHHVVTGIPSEEIARLADELKADLIVTATHGHSGLDRLVLGSTCEKLIRRSAVPVLAVKSPADGFLDESGEGIHLRKVLCPCDFSEFSHKAVPYAAELCRQFGGTLILAHVVDTWLDYPEFMPSVELQNSPHLAEEAKKSLTELASGQKGVDVEVRVESGVPHRELAELIEKEKIDLVVMTTHGRSGLAHFLLGSVTEKLIRTAACPVMTVRPKD